MWDQIKAHSDTLGRDISDITKAVQFYYSLAPTREVAYRLAEEILSIRYQRRVSFPTDDDNRFAFGTATHCARSIESFAKLGVTNFVFSPTRPPSEVTEQVRRFAEEILPQFR